MNLPEIEAIPRKDFPGGWKIFCIYCNRWHLHGRGFGHRVAHCCSESPYSKTGYVLIKK